MGMIDRPISFKEIFETLDTKILIPSFQRDYAQGRKNDPSIKRVRERFLNAIKNALLNKKQLSLDFIYGSIEESEEGKHFIPLDGQQRLTTLFLLHWYAAKKEKINKEDYSFLYKFDYGTRPSSSQFCKKLIDFEPNFSENEKISKQIINQYWFPYEWEKDPTISSMLLVIDDINELFIDVKDIWSKLINENNIIFYFLAIEKIGLTDEIYIKMNSRGKPLTIFEHFKAEFEKNIEKFNKQKADIIEAKIDGSWTDFLWRFRRIESENEEDQLIDPLFLNLFKMLCDIIALKKGDGLLSNRGYNEFTLVDLYFNPERPDINDNISFIESSFDYFDQNINFLENLFDQLLSTTEEDNSDKIIIKISDTNLLRECLYNYISKEGKRTSDYLTLLVLLYSFLLYLKNKDKITQNCFAERLRMVNNLLNQSLRDDLPERTVNNRIPSALAQTESIILSGTFLDELSGYNAFQLEEEKKKMEWRKENSALIKSLNRLENHRLLNGQISVVGLENSHLFDKFSLLFKENCNLDLISCAMLSLGNYARIEGRDRLAFGSIKESTWFDLFHHSAATRFDETKKYLNMLLTNLNQCTDDELIKMRDTYLQNCESSLCFDWRYYFINYSDFRPNQYGKYFIKNNDGYCITALQTRQHISPTSFQPFLKVVDSNHIDTDYYGERLSIDGYYIYCEEDRFVIKDEEGNQIGNPLQIEQYNGIDKEDRIKKYKSNENEFLAQIKANHSN